VICNKFRLFPSKAQEAALNETLAVCRLVYNSLLHERTALHEQGLKAPTYYTQAPAITQWKKTHLELKTVHSQVLQNVAVRVDLAFQAFFRRVKKNDGKAGETPGYPRMKGRGQYDSITYPGSGFKIASLRFGCHCSASRYKSRRRYTVRLSARSRLARFAAMEASGSSVSR